MTGWLIIIYVAGLIGASLFVKHAKADGEPLFDRRDGFDMTVGLIGALLWPIALVLVGWALYMKDPNP